MALLEFDNRRGWRARVWLDELPTTALLSNDTVREIHVFECGSAVASRKSVAVEVFQPFGASFHYGLLGGEYRPIQRRALEVIIPTDTPSTARLYADSLAGSLDTVTIGGLPEYATGICTGLQRLSLIAKPCGALSLTCMAYGEVGSAPIIFGSLARALILVLCSPGHPSSLDEAMALLAAQN
ncbi:hypothetical protein FRZ44_17370 [Hypericibacter terrae]|uniref:Uncharacterized protein n=1 Tax=Hypericibacter terrae TaxID=2602015 RepID=A0A5J6MG20_9PROT|nr:hypothetical protein FRZ44_17370 [Hypericibacter terrae]